MICDSHRHFHCCSMSDSVNIAAYIGVIYPMLLLVSFGLVFIYAEQGFPWHSYFTLTVGYFASFGILFLVPIDIASIVIARRSTSDVASSGYNDYRDTISPAYSTFFSLVLIFGSVILVFEEYYNTDGNAHALVCMRILPDDFLQDISPSRRRSGARSSEWSSIPYLALLRE